MNTRRLKEFTRVVRKSGLNLPALIILLLTPLREKRVSQATWRARMHECVRCPAFGPTAKQCNLCGCYAPFKALYQNQTCPAPEELPRRWNA